MTEQLTQPGFFGCGCKINMLYIFIKFMHKDAANPFFALSASRFDVGFKEFCTEEKKRPRTNQSTTNQSEVM